MSPSEISTLTRDIRRSKKEKKKTKTRSKSSCSSRSSRSGGRSKASKANAKASKTQSFVELQSWDTRGICCCVCGVSDEAADNVMPHKKRLWGYPPIMSKKTGHWTTQGRSCLVCTKVQMAMFYPKIKLADMKSRLGEDAALMEDSLRIFALPTICTLIVVHVTCMFEFHTLNLCDRLVFEPSEI